MLEAGMEEREVRALSCFGGDLPDAKVNKKTGNVGSRALLTRIRRVPINAK